MPKYFCKIHSFSFSKYTASVKERKICKKYAFWNTYAQARETIRVILMSLLLTQIFLEFFFELPSESENKPHKNEQL